LRTVVSISPLLVRQEYSARGIIDDKVPSALFGYKNRCFAGKKGSGHVT
jgi:hypothetical protein